MAVNASQIVPKYISDESFELSNENLPPTKRQRRTVVYSKTEQTFPSLEEAQRFVTNQRLWKFKSDSNSFEGIRFIYLCKYSNKCSARMSIFLDHSKTQALVQSSEDDHDHPPQQLQGIERECKAVILELWSQGTRKPKAMLDVLRSKGTQCPTTSQLYTFLVGVRRGEGPPILSLGQLESFLVPSYTIPPLSECDQAFVVNSYFNYDKKNFGVFWSSHRLLALLDKSLSINIDATYKLTFLGFPVLITGTTDKQKRFHPFGIALLSNEDSESFAFVFESLLKVKPSYKPTVLIADCAPAITKAFESIFGSDFTRLVCWYHVKHNLDNKLKSVPKEKYDKVQADLFLIQISINSEQFKVAANCFVTKWSNDEHVSDFIRYFKTEYLDQRFNWFEGAALGYPSTNNALEATNSVIKKEHTFRERLSVKQFIETAETIVRKWSTERNPNDPSAKLFADEPKLTTSLQSQAYQIAKSKSIQIKTRVATERNLYFFPSSESKYKNIKEEEINAFLKKTKYPIWRSFDSYSQFRTRMWVVDFNDSEWLTSTCTCPPFLKNYICKHTMAVAIINKQFQVKPEAKSTDGDLGKKRQRGRPKKATKALVVD